MFEGCIFFFFSVTLVHMSVVHIYVDNISHFGLSDTKVSHVLVCSLLLLLFEKINQRNCIKFCVKNKIKCARTLEMLTVEFGACIMSRTQVQL